MGDDFRSDRPGRGPREVPADVDAWRHTGPPRGSRALGSLGVDTGPGSEYSAPPVLVVPPPQLIQYPAASDVQRFGSAAVAVGATAEPAGLAFTAPDSSELVVRSVVLMVLSMTPADVVTFTLLRDAQPIEGWTVTMPPQNAATAILSFGPDETLIRVPSGSTFSLRFAVTAGAGKTCTASWHGWFYPSYLADRYRWGS